MSKMRLISCLCAVVAMTVALCGCAGDKSRASSSIVIGIPQDLEDSLDPHKVVAAGTKEILFNIYEGLLKPDSQGNLIPAVAQDYTVSDDGLTYTFTLRDGVKFHNGNAVTVDDVVYSISKSAGLTGQESRIPAFSAIQSVNAIDDKTVEICLNAVNVDFPAYLAQVNASIIPKDNSNPDTEAIGTGPYCYVSRSPQENIIVKKYADYWGDAAYIENVTFKIIADADSIVMNLIGGSVDLYARLSKAQTDQIREGFNILEGSMNLVQAVYLNNAVAPFDDIRVRQALCYATDVKEILDLTSDGEGFPIGSSMFPAFGKYYVDLADTYPYDPNKAKELLAEAGYSDGLSFTITVPSNYQPHIDAAQVVSEQYKRIGVDAKIQLVEWNSWLSDVYSGRNFEATLVGVDASFMTASAMLERFETNCSKNFVNFSNEEFDKLYAETLVTQNDEERTEKYKTLQKILADEAANVYIQDMAEYVALSDKFEGYEFYPMYVMDVAKIKPVTTK